MNLETEYYDRTIVRDTPDGTMFKFMPDSEAPVYRLTFIDGIFYAEDRSYRKPLKVKIHDNLTIYPMIGMMFRV